LDTSETSDADGNGTIEEKEKKVRFAEKFDVTALPEMKKAFTKSSADQEINCDKWGCWLSGYAPIIDKKGNAIAILGVDIPAEQIIRQERKTEIAIMTGLGIIATLFPLFLFLILKYLLKPIATISDSIEKFGDDMSTRIDIRSHDEFGLIATNFNRMADELELVYLKMEKIVKQKTQKCNRVANDAMQKQVKEKAFLESVGEGVVAVDRQGKIILANRQAKKILAKTEAELLGKNYANLIKLENDSEKRVSINDRPISKTLSVGEKVSGKYFFVINDKKIPVHITASPIIYEKKTIGAIAVFRDITKEIQMDRAKTEFISLASHQLRTPLSIVNWHCEILKENQGNLSEKQKKYLDKINHANRRMIALVKSLLNVSRLEMGTFTIESEKFEITKVAEDAIKEIKPLAAIQNIMIEKKFSKDNISFKGDPQLVNIVMQNLLSNAIKYSERDGKVLLEIIQEPNSLVLRVIDNGMGIPNRQKNKIFNRFFRADNAKEKETDGTGLGLYLTKEIVTQSGGAISFESTENKGTTFTVKFPADGMQEKDGPNNLL
jgi:PAS domain S-box-containing protein